MTAFTYDPLRIIALRQRTVDAIDELAQLHSPDPAAASALHAIGLMRLNLEGSWLRLIEQIYQSPAMVDWRELDRVDGPSDALARLVDEFGARAVQRRRRSRDLPGDVAGIAPVQDHVRTAIWRSALRALDEALSGSGSLAVAMRRLEVLTIGTALPEGAVLGLDELVGLLGSLHWALAHDHVSIGDADRLETALVGLMIRAIGSDADLDIVGRAAAVDPGIGALVARHHRQFPPGTTLRLATAIISRPETRGFEPAFAESLASLLVVIGHTGDDATRLLADAEIMARLVTDPSVDADAVELVVASAIGGGLGAAGGDGHDGPMPSQASLGVLAGLTAIAGDHRLSSGARRGTARGLGPVLSVLGIHLDRRRPVNVALGTDTVRLGDHDALADLISQVLEDAPAQMVLGTMIGAYRMDQLENVHAAVADSEGSDPGTATRMIGAALADVTRVLELVGAAQRRHVDTELLDFAMSKRQVQQVLTTLGIAAALLTGPAGPFVLRASHLVSLSAAEIVTALAPDGTERIGEGLQATAAVHFTAAAVSMVVDAAPLRRAVGLEHLDDDTVERLGHHLRILDDDPSDLDALVAIESIMAADPALDTYLETVRAISGEDSLG